MIILCHFCSNDKFISLFDDLKNMEDFCIRVHFCFFSVFYAKSVTVNSHRNRSSYISVVNRTTLNHFEKFSKSRKTGDKFSIFRLNSRE